MHAPRYRQVPLPGWGDESIAAESGASMTDHLHVRIAWIRRRLPVPGAPPRLSPGLHDPMRTVCCWNGHDFPPPPSSHLLSISQLTVALSSLTQ